ncbi:MAG TPA: cation-transporting P-type ATPase [Acidothermaceae bacterium]
MTQDRPADDVASMASHPLHESLPALLRRLRTSSQGLSQREAARRLQTSGPNQLPEAARQSWVGAVAAQLVHPLALVLWAAAALSIVAGTPVLSVAIALVIVVNAVFSFTQERQAQRAVAALSEFVPHDATVVRDGQQVRVPAAELVVGDLLVVEEGDRVSADARLVDGAVEVDMSPLTGESAPVTRAAGAAVSDGGWLATADLLFSGTMCTAGAGRAIVLATGTHTELGRIAALSQRQRREHSPLERQVRSVAWLIAAVGVAVGAAFMPLGVVAGLSAHDAFLFAVGLLVANVPEGLLPTITLALAVGVRSLARRGAVVKRLSAVEVLGSTTVICTDKTGTLTANRMRGVDLWTPVAGRRAVPAAIGAGSADGEARALADAIVACSVVTRTGERVTANDPTELALYEMSEQLGGGTDLAARDAERKAVFRFSSSRRLMSTAQQCGERQVALVVKGAPESVLDRCASIQMDGRLRPLDSAFRDRITQVVDDLTREGLRVLGIGRRLLDGVPADRDAVEHDLTLLGLAALFDPPRAEVPDAVDACHRAGIRIHVVTGDNGATAAHVAREVGIGRPVLQVVAGVDLDRMTEDELDRLLATDGEIVFARSSPEAKLRIADALRDAGQVVAMTGDGVNDAPALHRADIGVAMGRGGTDVAREAATMVLTDDNFATIATAVEEGRRVYDNVRKFILYIFAHAIPEVVPFLVFALAGGLVPLPLTVMQILAIDLGTETLPALALGREPPEPGLMDQPPRARSEHVVQRALLFRAWGFMGVISAVLVLGAFFFTLWLGGWRLGDATDTSSGLHHAYVQATTATFVGIVACQVGTAFAARTDLASLRSVGLTSNPLLLWGIGFEIAFTALLVLTPGVQAVFDTAALPWPTFLMILTFPLVVWGADEWRRSRLRQRIR